MTDGGMALEFRQRVSADNFADKPHSLVDIKRGTFAFQARLRFNHIVADNRNTGALLPAVLQGKQPMIDQRGRVVLGIIQEYPENPALLTQFVIVKYHTNRPVIIPFPCFL